ncbi:MAG: RNA polymerase sigma factor [Armatimonadetes bacterium]|nr:RNA polymerase sigma factor [Armatimonadota bacterium]
MDKNWERWLDSHGDRIFRLSLRLCGGCYADAEDLTQEALIAAFQSRPRFAGRAKLATFLHAVALNCWRKRLRSAPPQALPLLETDTAPGNAISAHLTRLSSMSLKAPFRAASTRRSCACEPYCPRKTLDKLTSIL